MAGLWVLEVYNFDEAFASEHSFITPYASIVML